MATARRAWSAMRTAGDKTAFLFWKIKGRISFDITSCFVCISYPVRYVSDFVPVNHQTWGTLDNVEPQKRVLAESSSIYSGQGGKG